MLRKFISRVTVPSKTFIAKRMQTTQAPAMFCMQVQHCSITFHFASCIFNLCFVVQCEQTSGQVGCTTVGVCGKDASTSALQDLQLHYNIGVGQWAHAIETNGGRVPESAKDLLLDSTFATLTNVNFDSNRFYEYLNRSNAVRETLKAEASRVGVNPSTLQGPAHFQYQVLKYLLEHIVY